MDSKKEIEAILSENTLQRPEQVRPMLEDHVFGPDESKENQPEQGKPKEDKSKKEESKENAKQKMEEYLSKNTGRSLEYLVRGATLECRMGSVPRKLNLLQDHGVYITDKPVVHRLNCDPGEGMNIPPFGVCKVTQKPCMPIIVGFRWWDTYSQTRIVDNGSKNPIDRAIANMKSPDAPAPTGEDSLTTLSFLICSMGGLIEPKDSGQGQTDAPGEADTCKKMQEKAGRGSMYGSIEDEEAFLKQVLLDMGWKEKYLTDKNIRDLREAIHRFNITTEDRLAHFLAQISVESGYGKWKKELGGEAYFTRLYWDKQKKAKELGNESKEDAIRYSGGGYIQVTGKNNYQKFSDYMESQGEGDPSIMEKGKDCVGEDYPWTAAGHWWESNGMNESVDDGASVLDVSRKVNIGPNDKSGTPNHKTEREEAHKKASEALKKHRSDEGSPYTLELGRKGTDAAENPKPNPPKVDKATALELGRADICPDPSLDSGLGPSHPGSGIPNAEKARGDAQKQAESTLKQGAQKQPAIPRADTAGKAGQKPPVTGAGGGDGKQSGK